MEDAIIERPKEPHAFFKQFKRKQPSDFKGAAGAAQNANKNEQNARNKPNKQKNILWS